MLGTSLDLIEDTLHAYGAAKEGVRLFEWDSADLLAYATLASARREQGGDLQALCGIYEWQQQPLAFLVDGQLIDNAEHLLRIRRLLAMRGGAPYLALIRQGSLTVYSVALDEASAGASKVKLPKGMQPAQVVPYLSNARPGKASRRRWIEQVVLSLLNDTINRLITTCGVASTEAISLVGRALSVRFLADRSLLSERDSQRIARQEIGSLFDTASSAVAINKWLDDTFNGDLLPLKDYALDHLPADAFVLLGNILRRAPGGQLSLDWREDWAHLDFAYIPVGVLSQAYEHFLRSHNANTQEKEGGFYTPAPIAQMMLRGAMHALADEGRSQARVLDPAAGAGVFLISAFRQLVATRWVADQSRPDTAVLRKILYKQIAGFDVNEEALRFAALGLYLISIELDPNPRPVQKLKFEHNLRGRVLFKVGGHGSAGSLGYNVDASHDASYDLVIGNPPWSSSTKLHEWPDIVKRVREVAEPRLKHVTFRPQLPNEVLDLPFVWQAIRWCRPGGQIAFVLHARLLFQQGDNMPEARNAILSALDITGIVNGSDLRNSRVWPDVAAPFCLLFARNAQPTAASSFRYVSPRREDRLNAAGVFRIDAANAPQLTPTQVIEQPNVLKVLYRGGPLDLELLERMKNHGESLDTFWRSFGVSKGKASQSGNGYQLLRESSKVNREGERGTSATALLGKPLLTASPQLPLLLDSEKLPTFKEQRVHRVRSFNQYQGPLLIVHKSPPAHLRRLNVAVSDKDVVYNESFYGYSAHGHKKGRELVRFIALIVGSKVALWTLLLTSGEFGFEREVVEKSMVDALCIPAFDRLSEEEVATVVKLFDEVASASGSTLDQKWEEVDAWAAKIYGLKASDTEIIADTLEYSAPFADCREAAQRRPAQREIDQFLSTLEGALQPFAKRFNRSVDAREIKLAHEQPWLTFKLTSGAAVNKVEAVERDIEALLHMADGLGTTEVVSPLDDGGLLVARLDQSRYWAPTQARLFARRVVWEHRQHLFQVNA